MYAGYFGLVVTWCWQRCARGRFVGIGSLPRMPSRSSTMGLIIPRCSSASARATPAGARSSRRLIGWRLARWGSARSSGWWPPSSGRLSTRSGFHSPPSAGACASAIGSRLTSIPVQPRIDGRVHWTQRLRLPARPPGLQAHDVAPLRPCAALRATLSTGRGDRARSGDERTDHRGRSAVFVLLILAGSRRPGRGRNTTRSNDVISSISRGMMSHRRDIHRSGGARRYAVAVGHLALLRASGRRVVDLGARADRTRPVIHWFHRLSHEANVLGRRTSSIIERGVHLPPR